MSILMPSTVTPARLRVEIVDVGGWPAVSADATEALRRQATELGFTELWAFEETFVNREYGGQWYEVLIAEALAR